MDALALLPCRDVKIGSAAVKGISGGQAKRVNIGIALVSNPRVMFLVRWWDTRRLGSQEIERRISRINAVSSQDEPTSGLDSFTANEVMTYVKELVSEGVTICATSALMGSWFYLELCDRAPDARTRPVHSPTAYAFGLFDSLMMLTRGRVVYCESTVL